MMEKNYELVAWTRNITDFENARLYVHDPDVELDLLEPLFDEAARCRKDQESNGGKISEDLALRFVKVYEDSARLDVLLGNVDYAIRFYLQAAEYLMSLFPDEFLRLCEEAVALAEKYGFRHVLKEFRHQNTVRFYRQCMNFLESAALTDDAEK